MNYARLLISVVVWGGSATLLYALLHADTFFTMRRDAILVVLGGIGLGALFFSAFLDPPLPKGTIERTIVKVILLNFFAWGAGYLYLPERRFLGVSFLSIWLLTVIQPFIGNLWNPGYLGLAISFTLAADARRTAIAKYSESQ
jgi:hypothetical protein